MSSALEIEYFQPFWLFSFGDQPPIYLKDQGLVAVLGENRDEPGAGSNEAGKTVLLEALVWTLTGKSLRFGESPGDDVCHVNRPKKTGTFGLVTFTVNDRRYRVTRARQHPVMKSEVFFDEEIPDGQIGENGDEWTSLQGHNTDATTERILQTLGFDFSLFWYALGFAQDNEYRFAAASDTSVKRVLAKVLQFRVIDDCVRTCSRDSSRMLDENGELLKAHYAARALVEEQEKALQELDFAAAAYQAGRGRKEALADLGLRKAKPAKAKAEIDAIHSQLIVSRQKHRELSAALRPVEFRLATITEQLRETEEKLGSSRLVLKTAEKRQEQVYEYIGKECSGCGRVYTKDELPYLRDHVREEVAAAALEVMELSKAVRLLQSRRITSLREQRRLDKAMTALTDQQDAWAIRVDELAPVAAQLVELDAEEERMRSFDEAAFAPSSRMKKRVQMVLARERANARHLQRQVDELERKRAVCGESADLYQKLKGYLLEDSLPVLNKVVNTALRQMTDGTHQFKFTRTSETKKGEVRDRIGRELISPSGIPYKGRSAGWKRRIDLAEAYGLQRLIASRQGRRLGLAAYDDVLNELDDEGRSRVLTWLQSVAEKTGTVLVMSPTDTITSYFSTVWRVVKEHGISRVEVST